VSDVPVERRTYYRLGAPPVAERRPCPVCGRRGLVPWTLRRDRERRVWRRFICLECQAHQDVAEDASA
jgi:hypothetical protein